MKIAKKQIRILGIAVTTLALLVSFQNCAKANFTSTPMSSGDPRGLLGDDDDSTPDVITDTGRPSCREELRTLTVPVKTIFVVDGSGSNLVDGDLPGTDPDKAVRGGSMQRFLNSHKDRNNFAWSLIRFAGTSATALATNVSASPMQSALDSFMAINDAGHTPYVPALDSAATAIQKDSSRTAQTKYIVVFLSDGMPNPSISNSELTTKVKTVINAAPGQVNLSAVYYGHNNSSASDRLKMMAQVGGGNFLDTNANPTGTAFLISDLVTIPGIVCN